MFGDSIHNCTKLFVTKDDNDVTCDALTGRALYLECKLKLTSAGVIMAHSRLSGLRGSVVHASFLLDNGKTANHAIS